MDLSDLTTAQRAAVEHAEGPLLVLAGPGSGKTRVITRRIARLVERGVAPWQILAVTFTNKAAGEMKHRVAAICGEQALARGLTVTTFHSLCVRLLRRYSELWRDQRDQPFLKPDFSVYDDDDQQSLIKRVLAAMSLSGSNWSPRTMLSTISSAKNQLQSAEDYAAASGDFYTRTVARVFGEYEKALRAANAVDFDDLLVLTANMLKKCDAARAAVQSRFRYLLVDEYQDTNRAQFVIASLIAAPPGANICAVGDPDQSIYGWRGADLNNILQFEEVYPKARVIALGENFRSVKEILSAADRLIRCNKHRKHKPLISTRGPGAASAEFAGRPAPVQAVLCRDEHHEAAVAVDWLKALREHGQIEWKDAAVFYRTNALSRVVEDRLRAQGIPYLIVRGTAFYQREEIKHALAYLRVIANPADAVSLRRIVNTPARGISDATIDRLDAMADQRRTTLLDAMRDASAAGLAPRAVASVAKFVALLDAWREAGRTQHAAEPPHGADAGEREPDGADEPHAPLFAGWSEGTDKDAEDSGDSLGDVGGEAGGAGEAEGFAEGALAELVERVVRESGLEQLYRAEDERLENLAELVSSAREFESSLAGAAAAGAAGLDVAGADDAGQPPAGATPTGAGLDGELVDAAAPDFLYDPAFDATGGSIDARDRAPLDAPPARAGDLLDLLRAYLERVALVADTDAIDPRHGSVTLMTLHAAKGLEYKAVALIGLEEGLLPHSRAITGLNADADMEEERRLAFVGVTRAMDRLLLTAAAYRTIRGLSDRTIPSRFLDELDGEGFTRTDLADPFGGRGSRGWGNGDEGDGDDAHEQPADDFDQSGDAERQFIARGRAGGPGASPLRPARSIGQASAGGGGSAASGPGGAGKPAAHGFRVGDTVRHPQFGVGTINEITPGADPRARVAFRSVGIKTLVLAYARLERLGG